MKKRSNVVTITFQLALCNVHMLQCYTCFYQLDKQFSALRQRCRNVFVTVGINNERALYIGLIQKLYLTRKRSDVVTKTFQLPVCNVHK